uniref:Uncharacterized protein n=1 Tax=Anopheles dirus TaxID=7168 RepID=A0A182N3V1_9DIPT
MPYTLVKIITSTGLKKEVTAPDRWIQEKTGNTYLRWPNHVTTQKVNELLADEHSMPTEEWTVQKCSTQRIRWGPLPTKTLNHFLSCLI